MKELDFKLTIEEVNLVLLALGKLPYETSYRVLEKIRSSGDAQLVTAKLASVDEGPRVDVQEG